MLLNQGSLSLWKRVRVRGDEFMNERSGISSAAVRGESGAAGRNPPGESRNGEASEGAAALCPQVKICGLTREDEASACAEAGASAVGCVFYPPSPRYVSEEIARSICRAVSPKVPCVGVFVNEGCSAIMRKVERCGLKAVQLHGKEPPSLVQELHRAGIAVIKAVFENADPSFASVDGYDAEAYLVECAGGPLPGGNSMGWNWSAAAELAARRPVILAGGLSPENVGRAIRAASPDAVDVSSGVESRPGRKDIDRVRRFLEPVCQSRGSGKFRRIFK